MKQGLLVLLFAISCTLVGCSASQLSKAAESGMLIAGQDPEKARSVGASVGKVAGATGTMPLENEIAIGEGIALKSFTNRGALHPDKNLQRYVNLVGKTVASVVPRSEVPYIFAVVESDHVDAWAAPGGYVFITTAALRQMHDEAQLAGVLGHELVHINERHMVKMLQRADALSGLSELATVTDEKMAKYSSSVSTGEDILFKKGFDRNMEIDADLVGTEYATLAGYDPAGLRRYLATFSQNPTGGGWLSSTHPTIADRIAKIDEKLNGDLKGYTGAVQGDRFIKNVTRVLEK